MRSRKLVRKRADKGPRARNGSGRSRQRQRLIEACISALHLYGPSRTTVEKVVAIAKMSPGIVRFYFDSKAAMLVASLQFLSAEFEEQVLIPATLLKTRPVEALQLMVDLYLDPEIASPRKVSVWYAFWGEASSRQEYYDICGQQDESFAALVRELIKNLIVQTSHMHLDADGIALGLIGVLEILWQDIAFQTERDIDRPAAKRRCLAYLRSVFPGSFAPIADDRPAMLGRLTHLPRGAYDDMQLWSQERASLFQTAWVVVGHESQLPRYGDYVTVDTGVERALLVRDESGVVHALRNCCPELPHALVNRREGHFEGKIECAAHGMRFSLAGVATGQEVAYHASAARSGASLKTLELAAVGGLLWVRPSQPDSRLDSRAPQDNPPCIELASGLMMLGPPKELVIAANWKVLVEQWLESVSPDSMPGAASVSLCWDVSALHPAGWGAHRYRKLLSCLPEPLWRRHFIAPHQLVEVRSDGISVLQAQPTAPGQTLLRRLDYSGLPPDDSARVVLYLAQRLGRLTRTSMLNMAESVQRGISDFGYEMPLERVVAPPVAWFRALWRAGLPQSAIEQPPAAR